MMTNTKYYLKVPCLILILLAKAISGNAQQMNISGMHHNTLVGSKNIYLLLMDTMMVKMDKIPAVTSPESDFLYQMILHHEGAIAMAQYEITHGKDFEVLQLAKSILAEQATEIQQMRLWLKQPGTKLGDLHSYNEEMAKTMKVMMDTMPADLQLKNIDQAFALVMIPHHQAAVDMAKVLLKYSRQPLLTAYGKLLISNEIIEIGQMKEFLK